MVAERLGFRDRIRRHPILGWVYRILVAIVGTAILVVGIIMIPAPGPGWLVVFLGLGVLGTEFAWARRLLEYGRRQFRRWTDWIKRQSLFLRFLIGLAGIAVLAGVVLAGLHSVGWMGFPFS